MANKERLTRKKALTIGVIGFLVLSAIVYGFFSGMFSAVFSGAASWIASRLKPDEVGGEGPGNLPHVQVPVVGDLNRLAIKYLRQTANYSTNREKQASLETLFDILHESFKIDKDDPQTHYLYAEALLLSGDFGNANTSLNIAKNQYEFKGDLYSAYGHVYEKIGDQRSLINRISEAGFYYELSVKNLIKAAEEHDLSFHTISEINQSLSRIKEKLENNRYVEDFLALYSLKNRNSSNPDFLYRAEKIAGRYTQLHMWRIAVLWNHFLYNQDTVRGRRERIIKDLQTTSNKWEFGDDGDFEQEIYYGSARYIINGYAELRQKPTMTEGDIIREMELYEEGYVFQRSEYKQRIGSVEAYWYRIFSDKGDEGFVFGAPLMFYPEGS